MVLVRSTSSAVAVAESSLRTVGSFGWPLVCESTLRTSEPEKPPWSFETVIDDAPE